MIDIGSEPSQWAVPVTEASQVAEARRRATMLAGRLAMPETRAGALAVVVTEIGNNLARHAQQGTILLRALEDAGGVEVLAIDRGPGMADPASCLRDGFSSIGTAGNGLGAIARMADEFDIYTAAGGTALVARVFGVRPPRRGGGARTGVVCLPVGGEDVSGDGCAVVAEPGVMRLMLTDGLGHGPIAAEAARAALAQLGPLPDVPLAELFRRLHEALRPTRGAVAGVADLDFRRRVVRYAGLGNVSATIWSGGVSHGLASMNGILGHGEPRFREFSCPMGDDVLVVLHSDGLSTKADPSLYPGLAARDPSLVAGILYRDFARGRDDVAVLVAGEDGGGR